MRQVIKNKQKSKNFSIKGIEVMIVDPVSDNINVKNVLAKCLKQVPHHLLTNLDIIYVGQFKHLIDRQVQAIYKDSSIFMTNHQVDEQDMVDDIIHEIAHSVEEIYKSEIYSDNSLKREFLSKRKALWALLKQEGYELELNYFLETEYNPDFDNFLHTEVGYPVLSMLTAGLFYSPYGATCLREYFANGFEAFFTKDDVYRIKKTSPYLYEKLIFLSEKENFI
tara:strand:+ start:4388 stop:5056 length:669 start_codon:yes stop_codon:yes gene_type:complete